MGEMAKGWIRKGGCGKGKAGGARGCGWSRVDFCPRFAELLPAAKRMDFFVPRHNFVAEVSLACRFWLLEWAP
jgi:hypothetical protein